MKKKIIYFCAGVLLTSLILVALQTYATAPNPGHDTTQISGSIDTLTLGGKSFVGMLTGPSSLIYSPYSGTCTAWCISKGLTCQCVYYYGLAGSCYAEQCGAAGKEGCQCNCVGCGTAVYK